MNDAIRWFAPAATPLIEQIPEWVDPLAVLETCGSEPHAALLLSGLESHPAARYSILGADPPLVLSVRDGEATLQWAGWTGRKSQTVRCDDPFELLRALSPAGSVPGVAGLPFTGGAIGYLGYGLGRKPLPPDATGRDPSGLPDCWFGLYDRAAVFDHRERRLFLVALESVAPPEVGDGSGRGRGIARARLAGLRAHIEAARPARAGPKDPPLRPREARFRTSRAEYLERIGRALGYIAAGDLYQVNLSHRIECPFEENPRALFRALCVRNPAPFAAFIDGGPFQVVSASPERLLMLRDGVALSSPIKGTRPRGATPGEDARLAEDLSSCAKDRAENVMIADLVRNDLGRACRPGSVVVRDLCALETYATVHHLVSTVAGSLRHDRDRIDLLRALFPGGSMTGAPKVRAMEVIDELEREERGVYAGSLGYLSLDGGMDFNIVIRSIVCARGRATLRVGGGIVADSVPEQEYRETLDKGRALLDVLSAGIEAEVRTPR